MQPYEVVLPHIDVVGTFSQVKVKDADGIHFLYLLVGVAQVNMLGDGLGHAIEDALQVVQLTGVLYFHDDDVALAILGLDVNPVELVVLSLLVPLALKNLDNLDGLIEKYGQESLQDTKVGLLSEQPLDGPVETYVLVSKFCHVIVLHYLLQR